MQNGERIIDRCYHATTILRYFARLQTSVGSSADFVVNYCENDSISENKKINRNA